MSKREPSLEWLRFCSTLAVILLHITGTYLGAATSTEWFGTLYRRSMLFSSLLHAATRFAVPCFIMLSGALALQNPQNREYSLYYRKTFRRIGPTMLGFSSLYFVCYLGVYGLQAARSGNYRLLLLPLWDLLIGAPGYHLWYLYMMVGIWLLTPLVLRFKESVGETAFARTALLFFPLAIVSLWQSRYTFYWSPGLSFSYLSYYMLGYVIHQHFRQRKSNLHAVAFFAVAAAVSVLLGVLRWQQAVNGIDDKQLPFELLQPSCPLPALLGVLVFCGFCSLQCSRAPLRFNRFSLGIYLLHPGILFVLQRFVPVQADCRIVTPLLWVCITLFSLAGAQILSLIQQRLSPR